MGKLGKDPKIGRMSSVKKAAIAKEPPPPMVEPIRKAPPASPKQSRKTK